MSTEQFIGLLVVILVHTGALFFWGGRVSTLLRVYGGEISTLREWKHNDATSALTDLKLRVGILEEQTKEVQTQTRAFIKLAAQGGD